MRRNKIILAALPLLLLSCTYDKEDELYGANGACDTKNVSYSITVNGLLSAYGCFGCHSGPSPEGNVNLQGYANVKAVASSGRLYGAISHAPGFQPMPQGGNKMSSCDLNKIKAWIDAGAPNN